MKNSTLFLVLFLLCSGCSVGQDKLPEDPLALAQLYAKEQGMDLSGHEVRSVTELEQGKNRNNVDPSRSDEFAKHFLGKLQGKRYWEVCYRTIERMLGGDVCYYIEKDSKQLLVVYRGQ